MKKNRLLLILAGIIIAAGLCLLIVKAATRNNGAPKADMFAVVCQMDLIVQMFGNMI